MRHLCLTFSCGGLVMYYIHPLHQCPILLRRFVCSLLQVNMAQGLQTPAADVI
jgi:hypothetical protein